MAMNQLERPAGITCKDYVALPRAEKPTCQHYAGDGACSLPDELMCVEWSKRNPKQAEGYPTTRTMPPAPPASDPLALDDGPPEPSDPLALDDDPPQPPPGPAQSSLLSIEASPPSPRARSAARPSPRQQRDQQARHAATQARLQAHQAAYAPQDPSPMPGFSDPVTPADVDALEARGFHFCLEGFSDQDVWLVPELTGQQRIELTFRDVATIANLLAAFPGSRVVRLKRKP